MNSLGKSIKRLRLSKGDTQEKLAESLHISCQAVSKWENDLSTPDIAILPLIADYFGVSIDELMNHKLKSYTQKERFVRLLHNSGVLSFINDSYRIDTEKLSTNAQLAKIGECFADFIRENNLEYDAIVGLAYHGIGFSAATAFSLYQKYGMTTSYCYDRKVPDSSMRKICGYTPERGDKIIVIDDVIGSGQALDGRLDYLVQEFDVTIAAIIAIVSLKTQNENGICGEDYLSKKYQTTVHTLISDTDIRKVYP